MTDGAADEIKQRLDIVDVVGDYVALKRSGQNFKGLCPFHAEKTPSFMVSQPKQMFHCFGCGAGGDLFAFVMKHEGLSFPEALELLAKRAGVELKPRSPQERGLKEAIKAANAAAQEFFARSLAESEKARGYLKRRGVSEEARGDFALGYAPEGWHALGEHLGRRGFKGEQLVKAGLNATGAKGPYDVFRGRLMFPIHDLHGDIVAFGGRALDEGQQPKYLNSPDTPVFHKRKMLYGLDKARSSMREAKTAIIAEGYLDVIMCHQHGIRNVVAPLGTALTEDHVKALSAYAENILLVFDGDEAGVSAAKRSLDLILDRDLRSVTGIYFLTLPEGEDPASILQNKGLDYLKGLIEKPKSLVQFFMDIGRKSPREKLDLTDEVLGRIRKVRNPLLRDELIREITEAAGWNEKEVRERLSGIRVAVGDRTAGERPKAFVHNAETFLLSAAIADPGKAGEILRRLSAGDFGDRLVRGIFEKLGASPAAQAAELDGASEEERALITRLSLEPGFDPDEADRVVEDCIRRIEKRRIDRKIEEARSSGDMALLGSLLSERQRLLQEAR
jgi:DNA primase